MSHIKDSFDDDELNELADEIRKDLLHQPSLHQNDSFVFKLQIDEEHEQTLTKHKSPPSWSYLTLSNTEDYTHRTLTPCTPNIITPLTPPNLICNDSFPDIPSPKTSIRISINNDYSWINKSTELKSPLLQLTDTSSINSDSTIISPRTRKRKANASIPDFTVNSNDENNLTFFEFKNNNKHTNNCNMSTSMDVNIGSKNNKEYCDVFVFVEH